MFGSFRKQIGFRDFDWAVKDYSQEIVDRNVLYGILFLKTGESERGTLPHQSHTAMNPVTSHLEPTNSHIR